jgi:hypothetical protein
MGERPLQLVYVAETANDRRDALLCLRRIDRSAIDPLVVVPREKTVGDIPYDPPVETIHTGADYRFEKLAELFGRADIVVYHGAFDPLTCEAARIAGTPTIMEMIDRAEPGQVFDYIDVTLCADETIAALQPDPTRVFLLDGEGKEMERACREVVARKGRRITPGPPHATPTPAAIVGDILFHFRRGDIERLERAAGAMLSHPSPLAGERLLDAVDRVATQVAGRGEGSVTDLLCRTLARSETLTAAAAKRWAATAPPGPGSADVGKWLMKVAADDPEGVALAVEQFLHAGKGSEALATARLGVQRFPEATRLIERYNTLRALAG